MKVDGEFDLEEFYWSVVGVFEGSGKFGDDLINWWNREVFGKCVCKPVDSKGKAASTLDCFKAHREAKLRASLSDRTNQVELG